MTNSSNSPTDASPEAAIQIDFDDGRAIGFCVDHSEVFAELMVTLYKNHGLAMLSELIAEMDAADDATAVCCADELLLLARALPLRFGDFAALDDAIAKSCDEFSDTQAGIVLSHYHQLLNEEFAGSRVAISAEVPQHDSGGPTS